MLRTPEKWIRSKKEERSGERGGHSSESHWASKHRSQGGDLSEEGRGPHCTLNTPLSWSYVPSQKLNKQPTKNKNM